MDNVRHWIAAAGMVGLSAIHHRDYSDFGGGAYREGHTQKQSASQQKRMKAKKAQRMARRKSRK